MEELVDLYFKHVEESFQPGSFSKDMYELMFLAQLNSYMLQFNPVIIGPNNVRHPVSLVSLVLSGSGSGKDSAIKFLEPLREKIDEASTMVFERKRDFLLEKENGTGGKQDSLAEKKPGQDFEMSAPKKSRKIPLEDMLATEHVTWVKSATDAGMNSYYATYSAMGFGAIGLSSTEFGQDFKDKGFREMLEKVLEMWDSPSKVASRITNEKGAIVFEGVQTCCMMHGAFDEFKKNDRMVEDLQTYLSTTMARRGLFVKISEDENLRFFRAKVEANQKKLEKFKEQNLSEDERNEVVDQAKTTPYMNELIEKVFFNSINKWATLFTNHNKMKKNGNLERPEITIRLSKGAEILLHQYQTGMEVEALKIIESGKISDKRLRIELQSRHLKAMRIAAMSSFYKNKKIISEDDVKYAVKIVQKSGKYFAEISKPSIIVDDVCEHLMKTTEKLTVRDLEDAEVIPVNMTKYRLQDLWERCAEELYQKNMIFRSTMGKSKMIQQVWIERLVETEGDIAHISYSTNDHMADVHMQTRSIPLHQILDIPDIKKMGAGGFRNNARSINNIEALGNVLIYDIDNGEITIDQAKDTFKGMMGFIYPTKSHMKPKKVKTGKKNDDGTDEVEERTCQRFRIVLLCKQHFPFGEDKSQANDEYKMLYAEIAKHFGIPFDENAMDSSRFYWIPEEAKTDVVKRIGKFDGKNKLDLTHFMPNLKIHNEIMSKSKVFDSKKYWENMSVRDILERCLKDSIIKQGRNSALFSMAMSLADKGESFENIKGHIYDVNDKFDSGPLDTAEVERSILTSLHKRMSEKGMIEK